MQRRTFIASTGAAAAAASVATQASAASKPFVDVKIDPWNQPPEMEKARYKRFIRQDDESRQDFTRGLASWSITDSRRPEKIADMNAFLRSKGLDPNEAVDLTDEECANLLLENPAYAARLRLTRSNFDIHWDNPRRTFFRDADYYIGEMEKTDKMGPGRLELNPQLDIPNYARHEIHAMPGGYVGCPFAGWTYDLGHIAGTDALKDHGRSLAYAQNWELPKDGKVVRVMDVGCGTGNTTLAVKERFPNTEVWGIDVGGPLVRYGHYTSVKRGLDIVWSQRDAGDTGFPDNHFDAIGSCILFHEVQPEAQKKILAEIHRILRPGGVYNHTDFITPGHKNYKPRTTIASKAGNWVDHRNNVETWSPAYKLSDHPELMRQAGFEVVFTGREVGNSKESRGGFPGIVGFKKA